MSEARKAKVARRKAAKQERTVTPIAGAPATFEVDSSSIAKAQLAGGKPATELAGRRNEDASPLTQPAVPKITPVTSKAEMVDMSSGKPKTFAETLKTSAEKPKTFADMLAEQRKTIEKEKTDAVKMQKYYALTDAFNALGKMSGAAIGGAIGGNVLDSAPAVAEYQPSRGYLIAFEEAKKANERLKAFGEKEFQIALRDEERSYKQQEDKLNRDWQKQMIDYKNEIDRANADKDFERSKQLKIDFAELEHKHDMELQRLRNAQSAADRDASRATMQFQYDLYNKPVQIAFDNGTGLELSENQYKGLYNYIIGKTIGGKVVTKDNIATVIRENPQIVNDYLKMFGSTTSSKTDAVAAKPVETATEPASAQSGNDASRTYVPGVDSYTNWRSSYPRNLVEQEPPTGIDIFTFERK